jgi:hypothetical protein
MSETSTSEAAAYLDRVAAALAGLPAEDREELLDDLRTHLDEVVAEVAATPGMTLESRLGAPEEYAADLRSSAGFAPGSRRPHWRPGPLAQEFRARPEVAAVLEFLPELRPAWWVLRGALLALVPVRLLGLDWFAGALLAVPAVVLSVRYARRPAPTPRWRTAQVGVNVLALVALGALVFPRPADGVYDPGVPPSYPAGAVAQNLQVTDGQVVNIYPYDKDGRPLHDVLLYDQDGHPISMAGDPGWSDQRGRLERHLPYGPDGRGIANAFPQEQSYEDDSQSPPVITRQMPPVVQTPVFSTTPPPAPPATPSPTAPSPSK